MVLTDYGSDLHLADREVSDPGPGEALVRVHYCGVCRSDRKLADGRLSFSAEIPLPHVLGHDAAGEVIAVGPGVALAVGTRVVVYNYEPCRTCSPCMRGDENNCSELAVWFGFRHPGGFQEHVIVGVSRLLPVPASLSLLEAATLSCGLATSYRAIVTRGAIRPGQQLAIVGCGGLGLHAVQLGLHAGAEVIAVDIDERARAAAIELGAHRAIDPHEFDTVSELTSGDGIADVVVEFSGTQASHLVVDRLLRPGGRLVVVGYEPDARCSVPLPRLALRELEIRGSRYANRDEFHRSMELFASGAVRPIIDSVYPLEEANRALARLQSGSPLGRIVIDVRSTSTDRRHQP